MTLDIIFTDGLRNISASTRFGDGRLDKFRRLGQRRNNKGIRGAGRLAMQEHLFLCFRLLVICLKLMLWTGKKTYRISTEGYDIILNPLQCKQQILYALVTLNTSTV
jgi:hypothetical protein